MGIENIIFKNALLGIIAYLKITFRFRFSIGGASHMNQHLSLFSNFDLFGFSDAQQPLNILLYICQSRLEKNDPTFKQICSRPTYFHRQLPVYTTKK